jgi:hypothetical protein
MKTAILHLLVCLLLCCTGCAKETPIPRFSGTIVSHVDSYGSGTGNSSQLSSTGQMRTGFDYSNDSKKDWTADIKWSFRRREGDADVYRIEWEIIDQNDSSVLNSAELSIDGVSPAKLPVTDQLIISIEPEESSDEA